MRVAVGQPAALFGEAGLSGCSAALYAVSCATTMGAGCCLCKLVSPAVQPIITHLHVHP